MIDLVLNEKLEILPDFKRNIAVKIMKIKHPKDLQKTKFDINIIEGCNYNREILETKSIDMLVSPEKTQRSDMLNQRNSGLNQVLCNLARKNGISIGFNIQELIKTKGVERAQILGRMKQNVVMCRKYKATMILASFAETIYDQKTAYELQQFGKIIGMTPKEAKEALSNIEKIVQDKVGFIKTGLRLVS